AKVADDLKQHHGRALVHVGPDQPSEIHALVHAMNEALGARGSTIELVDPVAQSPTDQAASLQSLIEDMRAGRVSTLLIIDSNPVYSAAAYGFGEALANVPFSLALVRPPSETAQAATWFVPILHPWEDWSDARGHDGTATVLQPQAMPLYDGESPHTILGLFASPDPAAPLETVKSTWHGKDWEEVLAGGVVPDSAAGRANVSLKAGPFTLPPSPAQPLTILFRPDPNLWDGRYGNNAWLLELPRPLSKLSWDNPLLIAPSLAKRMNISNGDRVRLSLGNASLDTAVWILPGQAEDCVTAWLGWGRKTVGVVGEGAGFDYYPLMAGTEPPILKVIDGHLPFASTDHHHSMLNVNADYARHGHLEAFQRNPRYLSEDKEKPRLYNWIDSGPAAWAMSVDLNKCIGCNACVVACQAENNIPTVGKDQVLKQREMYWLRIDTYYEGDPAAPDSIFQPVLCMHCEQAPCEYVCPVYASVHDSEGLNVQVYNRCVGTRFCSNNCPYKVRRFNFFEYAYQEHVPPQIRNPDVSVRGRGVMEKCSFCLQRIAEARLVADRENRQVADIRTACQQACPTEVFTFGNLNNPASEVRKRKQSPLDYALLADQNTNPRLTYEARISNPNPALGESRS
ncbi:MAG: 4Fe-4S dicluster domain-containing protein, partial [Acetobacteraceae bacterium]|nr:4Fe-4S dicluster domain-containing protein [Acetobacteraceae bacterium]